MFDQGHEAGALAKELSPDGIEVGAGVTDLDQTLRLTRQALKLRRPLFEAAFAAEGAYCRAGILQPIGCDQWGLIEVKSTTSAKEVHLDDLAFQAWVLTRAGVGLRRIFLLHINPEFIREGDVDPRQFFSLADLTAQTADLTLTIEDRLTEEFRPIGQPECPDIKIGPHCTTPYPCPLRDPCWSFLPAQNVTTLYRGGKKAFRLLDEGILALADIPASHRLTVNQEIQRQAAITGEAHIDQAAIASFLELLTYPVSFLDFETFATAIPLFDGLHPYDQVPFQFSLHVVRGPGAEPEHHPRPEFMGRLQTVLPETGSVVADNAWFELGRLKEWAREQKPTGLGSSTDP